MASIFERLSSGANRLAHAWNAFVNSSDKAIPRTTNSTGYFTSSINPSRIRPSTLVDRSIINSLYTRIGIDVAAVDLKHVYLDENGQYIKDSTSGLNSCLTLKANIDQYARHFRQDIAMTLCDKGSIAIVPVDTSDQPLPSGNFDIYSMRIGEIVKWYPQHVRVNVYNEKTGKKELLTLSKSIVAIIENPLYSIMNESNSTYQRLLRKLSLLDGVDEAASSGKLDIIIQLPYTIKRETRREQADQRARDIEAQLKGSKYGVAYTDATEKITQLNRPAENNMLAQIQYLMSTVYSQLGLSQAIFDGTADDKTLANYYNRTIEPILGAIAEAMRSTFLTKTARSQGQSIEYYRDLFKLLTIDDLAELADKLTRNEILSSNDVRSLIGFKPSNDPNADKLLNKNLPIQAQPAGSTQQITATPIRKEPLQLTSGSNLTQDPSRQREE